MPAKHLLLRNRDFRFLFSATALTNFGDGLVAVALPWLATMLTRDPVAIAAVAAANRLPWMVFSIPAGVIIDRSDRRALMIKADMLRACLGFLIAALAFAPETAGAVWQLAALAFLLGLAEVLHDNASQTILPSIVETADLEAANGQLWSIERLTSQFLAPPAAGILIAMGLPAPFGIHMILLFAAALALTLLNLPKFEGNSTKFWSAMSEGVKFMASDSQLMRFAVVLGLVNFLWMAITTVQVLFAQEVLGLSSVWYGFLLTFGAAGAITGSLIAPRLVQMWGAQRCLFLALFVWGLGYLVIGFSHSIWAMGAALFVFVAASMVWNVITVSWRQRRIPNVLLGRVNSIYRFFGWGSMPLGALAGGALVAYLEPEWGREMALRAPFVLASGLSMVLLCYGLFRLRLD